MMAAALWFASALSPPLRFRRLKPFFLQTTLAFPTLPMSSRSSSRPRPTSPSPPGQTWPCDRCTILNPVDTRCNGCLAPPPRSCARCTLINSAPSGACAVCSASRPVLCDVVEVDAEDPADPAVGRAFLPLRRCARKRQRERQASPDVVELCGTGGESEEEAPDAARAKKGNSETHLNKKTFKIMTYNVWFREDLELYKRMEALGDLIQHHNPDLICFQEVTPNIYLLLEKFDWWQEYKCSMSHQVAVQRPYYCMQMSKLPVELFTSKPFANSIMGRELCMADINIEEACKFLLATSHLESPCPAPPRWDQMYSKERVAQANESLKILEDFDNVIFCGDMNWDDKGDGPFPLPDGWFDAWMELKPHENGWTYDTKANGMLAGSRTLQKRLDRFVCKLANFKIDNIEMIGQEAIQGASYCKEKKVRNEIRKLELPVLPSDHFGLLLTITYKE